MIDTSMPLQNSQNLTTPMVGASLSTEDGMAFFPLKEHNLKKRNCPRESKFSKWFDTDVLRVSDNHKLSRKDLIFHFRHENSAHISNDLRKRDTTDADTFAALNRSHTGAGGVWVDSKGNKSVPKYGQQFATIRQIGWEVEETLKVHCQEILNRLEAE
ncbi:MAG: hypothetical protein ABJX46_13905, partial [Erythrobacter sp.]